MERRKEKKEGEGFAIAMFLVFVICIIIGMATGHTLMGFAIGMGTDFLMFFLLHLVSIRKTKKSGVFVNVFVTDCRKEKQPTQNGEKEYYILSCEADDTRVFGTAEVCSEKYVPIGGRTVLFYSPREKILCPASELESEVEVVTLSASLLFYAGAVIAYFVKKYENVLISTGEICRIVCGVTAFCFIALGIGFFWIVGRRKKQSVENHRYPATLVGYWDNPNGNGSNSPFFKVKYPIWRYHYKGRDIEYNSKTEKRIWQTIGSRSEVYIPNNDEVFEKSEVFDSFLYGVIFFGSGIVTVILTIVCDFN